MSVCVCVYVLSPLPDVLSTTQLSSHYGRAIRLLLLLSRHFVAERFSNTPLAVSGYIPDTLKWFSVALNRTKLANVCSLFCRWP